MVKTPDPADPAHASRLVLSALRRIILPGYLLLLAAGIGAAIMV